MQVGCLQIVIMVMMVVVVVIMGLLNVMVLQQECADDVDQEPNHGDRRSPR